MSNSEENHEPVVQEASEQQKERIVIRRYWFSPDGEGRGYGTPRPVLIVTAILLLLFPIMVVILVLAHIPVVLAVCCSAVANVVLVITITHYSRQTGIYRLAAQGRPIHFLHKGFGGNESGMSRKRYLQRARQNTRSE